MSCGGRPAFMPSTKASALATLWMATRRLAMYFILLPLPKAPRSCTSRVKSANSGRSFLISAPPGLGLHAGAADRTIEQNVAGLAQSRFRRLFVFELERRGLDHDAARHARSSDGGDGRRERRRFRQAYGRLD